MKSSEIKQKFTHVATPEENSYIEAFHSILEHDVIKRNVFDSYYEAKEMLGRYFSRYNRTGGPALLVASFDWLYNRTGGPQQKWEEAQVIYATTAAAAAFSENLSS